jgi:hypothetical protein
MAFRASISAWITSTVSFRPAALFQDSEELLQLLIAGPDLRISGYFLSFDEFVHMV